MIPIIAKTRAEAWLKSALAIHKNKGRIHNLILEVVEPGLVTDSCRIISNKVDEFLRNHDCQPVHTVAETIFPAAEYRSGGVTAVLNYPEQIYPLIKKVRANQWGTYALRLTERTCSDGSTFNPLRHLLEKMKRQLDTKGPKRAVYELDLMSEPLDLKFYDAEADYDNTRGGQCLSHISFKLGPKRELYMTAIYRYQWFVQKALGNLLGLARLQDCVARELGVSVGPLVCHATLAAWESKDLDSKLNWSEKELSNWLASLARLCPEWTSQEAHSLAPL